MFSKKTIKDIDVKGKKVLVRVDFNVPIKDGAVADDTRVQAALPTLKYLLDGGAGLILCSHLGRPKGEAKPEFSLKPVAEHLAKVLGQDVAFAEDCIGENTEKLVSAMLDGDVLLLENVRFHAEERKNDPVFSKKLAQLGDVYANDAFGSAHRAHGSTVGVAENFDIRVSGFLMEKELDSWVKRSAVLPGPLQQFSAVPRWRIKFRLHKSAWGIKAHAGTIRRPVLFIFDPTSIRPFPATGFATIFVVFHPSDEAGC